MTANFYTKSTIFLLKHWSDYSGGKIKEGLFLEISLILPPE